MITLDIESEPFVDGAPALPVPVGCSIRWENGKSHYFSWGHPTNNNCTREEFTDVLRNIWHETLVTHNGCIFDVLDLGHHFDMPERDPLATEDTLLLAYLHNPHARSLKLKDLAADWLGMPPEEQQAMYDWIMANTDCRSRKDAGAWISKVPGDMAGTYAVGDTDRTFELFQFLAPTREAMLEAYNRERLLAPILADIQHKGVRVDLARLKADYQKAVFKHYRLTELIRAHLKQGPQFNPGSDKELGAALLELGYEGFLTTPTGKLSMARPSLEKVLANDPELMSLLKSRSIYDTLTGTFMSSWIEFAEANNGRIHASYNQTRNPEGYGTRTGRLSSSKPNFQNVPKDLGIDHFGDPFPEMRTYLLPDEGDVWVCGDFKNQEPRLTAHYEDDQLKEAFVKNPHLDPYLFVGDLCAITRPESKVILLGIIYAMGVATMADKLDGDHSRTTMLRNIVRASMPGVLELDKECKQRFQRGLPIRTLGGREYYCEPPSNGRQWDYKALNTLIQGSAADQTKQAIVYLAAKLRTIGARILGTVHDEISVSCKPQHVEQVKQWMQEAANDLPCDVPMIMDVASGSNWSEAKP